MDDRSWMYRRLMDGRLRLEYITSVRRFINFAFSIDKNISGGKIRCVCKHLLTKGFIPCYENWTVHGEPYVTEPILAGPSSIGMSHVMNDVYLENPYRNLVIDAMGVGDAFYNDNVSSPMVAGEIPNPEATKFFNLLKAAEEPLWDGCTKQSKLSACVQLLNMKSTFNLTQNAFNNFIDFTKSCMPNDENLVSNFYDAKKFMRPLGLGYEKFDVCPTYCMLYYGADAMKTNCDFCGSSRYKPRNPTSKGSNKAEKQLRYFPLTPRLQRLFMSPYHAKDMT
ncbi:PREDICTED: uncharacterized protein LOC105116949 [Populus euphratica]|uniref:Uncharacterized protein LOC105116949 n=1 Tax=Populus euphratica TaxID=75702 RepID=A0AAJ6XBH5_POPEU|nr:PREDICTED: uncharacterized protein LOC105116949 [Populus euphratica]